MEVINSNPNGRPDKNDVYLQDLVKAGNWKQALASIEKRLKKGKNDRLLLNKALILHSMPSPENKQKGFALIEELLKQETIINDLEICRVVDRIARSGGSHDELLPTVSAMWTRALKARPADEDICNEVFELRFMANDYEGAKKVAQTRIKSSRKWYFQYILCMHLGASSSDKNIPEAMKTMLRELALKSLAKAAEEVVPDPEFLENPAKFQDKKGGKVRITNKNPASKSLETSRQLEFLIEVYRLHGKYEQGLAILDDDLRTGLRSSIGDSWDLLRDKVELLAICQRWNELHEFCVRVLEDAKQDSKGITPYLKHAQRGNDLMVWQSLVCSTVKLQDAARFNESIELLHFFSDQGHDNARLAAISLHVLSRSQGHAGSESILGLCTSFYDFNHLKGRLFRDLSGVFQLSATDQQAFLDHIHARAHSYQEDMSSKPAGKSWLYSELNSLKFDYNLVVSQPRNLSNRRLLSAFVSNCLRLYKLSLMDGPGLGNGGSASKSNPKDPTERHVGDDAAVLAAMGLVHLWRAGQKNALLRGSLLLERVVRVSKHNYDALLLLIRLYLYQGMASQAIKIYQRLSIKNVQFQYAAWVYFTRISTLHPHRSKNLAFDPHEHLQRMTEWIDGSSRMLSTAKIKHLRHGTLRELLRNLSAFSDMSKNTSSMILQSELEQVEWINAMKKPTGELGPNIFACTQDRRDTTFFTNYEPSGQQSIESLLRTGPLPQMGWIRMQSQIRCTRRLLYAHGNIHPDSWPQIWALERHKEDLSVKKSDDITIAEYQHMKLTRHCCQVLVQVSKVSKGSEPDQALNNVDNFPDAVADLIRSWKSPVPMVQEILQNDEAWYKALDWQFFHDLYINAAQCRLYFETVRYLAQMEVSGNLTFSAEKEHFMVKKCQGLYRLLAMFWKDGIISDARELQTSLRGYTHLEPLLKHVLAKEDEDDEVAHEFARSERMEELLESKSFCKEVVDSYVDALDGIIGLDLSWLSLN